MAYHHLHAQIIDPGLRARYLNHSTYHPGDAGLDLFAPETTTIPAGARGYILNLGVKCEMFQAVQTTPDSPIINVGNRSYYLYPRSSLGIKTPLRMANSVGIIDSGYRGPICVILDNLSDRDWVVEQGERLVQICAPNLGPIFFTVVDTLSSSKRGENGLGSTN